MPLLDHFRFPRLGRGETPPPPHEPDSTSRLDRMVARQREVRVPSDLQLRLEAMEEEYSPPLYDSSAYSSGISQAEED
jgi:hypothetical protein